MKKIGYVAVASGIVAAGIVGYVLLNKNTRMKANKLLNTVMDEADYKLKNMNK